MDLSILPPNRKIGSYVYNV